MNIVSRIKNNKTLLNGGLFSIYSFFNEGISFVLLILLANYIAPAEYGKLSLFNTIVAFLGYFVALSSQGFISISYFKRGPNFFRGDVSAICFICVVVTSVFCIINMIAGDWLGNKLDLSVSLLWIAIIIAFLKVFQEMWLNFYRITEKVGKYGIICCSFAILNLILSLYLVIKTPLQWEGRIYAQLCCMVLFGLLSIGFFIKKDFLTINLEWSSIKLITLYGLPLIPHLTSLWIKQGGDRFIINHFHSMEDVGLYSFALNLTSIIVMLGNAFNNSNSVEIFKILSDDTSCDNKYKLLSRQTKNIALISLFATILIVVFVGLLVPVLLPTYTQSLPYFVILSFQGFGQCIYFLFCNYLFYYMKTKQLMYVTFFTSIIHLGLSLWLTRYSLYLTCIIYVLTQLLVTFIVYKISRNLLRDNLK